MASRNVKTYEAIGKLPSSTLKRHPKMDLNKNDLLRLLSYLEGELQARDISIAALKAEKAKQLLYQAKYGRFGLSDPFNALQRDSDTQRDDSFNENAVKAMYDNQLAQLENLIATQRRAQHRMREQLVTVEKRYHKACSELEEEKSKHEQDTAQGDDVTYMLEKDRERLKQELDFEKNQVKKLEKENKKLMSRLDAERTMSSKHKQVALVLIKERKHYMEKLAVFQHHNVYLDGLVREDKSKLKTMEEGLIHEGHKSLLMEAALEKHLAEFDTDREQLRGRLAKEEARNGELLMQLEQLQVQLGVRGTSPGLASGGSSLMAKSSPSMSPKVLKDTRVPVIHVRSDSAPSHVRHPTGELKYDNLETQDKPILAQKPADTSRIPPSYNSPATSSTVFTTPSGTRISLNVGASGQRKPGPIGRGIPPPLPPNKPQVFMSPTTSGRRDPTVRPPHGQSSNLISHNLGISIARDKITISNPVHAGVQGHTDHVHNLPASSTESPPSGPHKVLQY